MATRKKKTEARIKRKKAPTRKTAARKKTTTLQKKKISISRRATAGKKKKPSARKPAPPRRAAAPAVRPAQPMPPPVSPPPSAAPTAGPGELRVGVVTHYYTHLGVAVIRLEADSLRVGDTVHIRGHTSDFRQRVESMQIEHQPVTEVRAGQEFGLKVVDHAREHDVVFKVTSP